MDCLRMDLRLLFVCTGTLALAGMLETGYPDEASATSVVDVRVGRVLPYWELTRPSARMAIV